MMLCARRAAVKALTIARKKVASVRSTAISISGGLPDRPRSREGARVILLVALSACAAFLSSVGPQRCAHRASSVEQRPHLPSRASITSSLDGCLRLRPALCSPACSPYSTSRVSLLRAASVVLSLQLRKLPPCHRRRSRPKARAVFCRASLIRRSRARLLCGGQDARRPAEVGQGLDARAFAVRRLQHRLIAGGCAHAQCGCGEG